MSNKAVSLGKSHWTKLEAYFFGHGANIAFMALLMVSNVYMFVWGVWLFVPGVYETDNVILRRTLPIARGGGRLVTWNAACLLISGCKYFWTWVRRTPIQLGFPVDNVMPYYHRVWALTVIIAGCVLHTIPQIINYASQSLVPVPGQPLWGSGIATQQLLYTGSLLVVVFTMFFVTTLERVRRTSWGFRIFWWSHLIGIVCAGPLLLIHGTYMGNPFTIYFMVGPIALYLVDVVMRRLFLATLQAQVVALETHVAGSDQYVKVTIQQKDFRFSPGMYAELCVPDITPTEWHPFTIASAPNPDGLVVFYIHAVGRWTKALYELAESQAQESSGGAVGDTKARPIIDRIGLRGGFGAPAQNYFRYQHIVVIGSGIGVTPLLSVWNYMVSLCSQQADMDISRLRRSKSMRMPDSLKYSRLLSESDVRHVNVTEFDRPLLNLPVAAAYVSSVLETVTVNIVLFVFALFMELVVFCILLFGFDNTAAYYQSIVSLIVLSVFGSKVLSSIIAYGKRYLMSLVFVLEAILFGLDVATFVTSMMAIVTDRPKERITYFISFSVYIVVHLVRIFYIFYATARPPKIKDRKMKKRAVSPETIKTIAGVWVGKTYQAMAFAASDLVHSVQNLPPGFSLELYATRDNAEDCERNDLFVGCGGGDRFALRSGRPDWEEIIRRSLDAAHESSCGEGEAVGVFFCGSPAIAFMLQTVAQDVTAEHQYNHNGSCMCRVRVHKENF